jgi:hypothetical protein
MPTAPSAVLSTAEGVMEYQEAVETLIAISICGMEVARPNARLYRAIETCIHHLELGSGRAPTITSREFATLRNWMATKRLGASQ